MDSIDSIITIGLAGIGILGLTTIVHSITTGPFLRIGHLTKNHHSIAQGILRKGTIGDGDELYYYLKNLVYKI